jgi:hypothetical protein
LEAKRSHSGDEFVTSIIHGIQGNQCQSSVAIQIQSIVAMLGSIESYTIGTNPLGVGLAVLDWELGVCSSEGLILHSPGVNYGGLSPYRAMLYL